MKKNILKILNLFLVFAMTFSISIAETTNENSLILIEPETCDSQTFLSVAGENGAVAVDPINVAWTASIDGADWIWTENPISDSVSDVTETFTRTFNIAGTPSDSELEISADNQYKVTVNGNEIYSDLEDGDTGNYASVDTHTILAEDLLVGENTIEFDVLNIGLPESTPEGNPAGLIYKITVNCSPLIDTEPEPQECPAFAKIVIEEFSNKKGEIDTNGNMSDDIFLGSETDFINSGEQFSLDIEDENLYEDVPGLAVQRQNGKILVGIHGSLNTADREYVKGYIEFTNANVTSAYSDESDNNKLETLLNTPSGTPDTLVVTNTSRVDFALQVNTGDDFFFVEYDLQEGDCDDSDGDTTDDDEDPQCDVDCEEDEESCTENCEEGEDQDDGEDNSDEDENVSGGGGSSSGSRRSSGGSVLGESDGEVLGVCNAFNQYHKKGDVGGEVAKIQQFLNDQMNSGLIVDGVYGVSTQKAVHAFQQKYFEQIINPWVPPLMPKTTGRWYKSTRMMANELIGCPEPEVYLEDPGILYKVNWVLQQSN